MKIIERVINCDSRKSEFVLYAIGDVHLGAAGCAEAELNNLVKKIAANPNALWFGGGDMCDAVIFGDIKRFDINILPDWMLEGGTKKIKSNLSDLLKAQEDRLVKILKPIKDKCLGFLEGNHEYAIFKYHNRDLMSGIVTQLDTVNLTDCAFMRLKFVRKSTDNKSDVGTRVVTVFVCHGKGGGTTSSAEPAKLERLAFDKDVDIVLTGHTHTFHILPPIPIMTVPARGDLPVSPIIRERYAANWGSFLRSYTDGPSTYVSRSLYPARPMYTVETRIVPHKDSSSGPEICMLSLRLD
jgi:UDP-2,3-diacylglucosamine pyrophosphatase LpxH